MPDTPDSARPDAPPRRPDPGSPTFWEERLERLTADLVEARVVEAELRVAAISGTPPSTQVLTDALALVRVLASRLGQDVEAGRAMAKIVTAEHAMAAAVRCGADATVALTAVESEYAATTGAARYRAMAVDYRTRAERYDRMRWTRRAAAASATARTYELAAAALEGGAR